MLNRKGRIAFAIVSLLMFVSGCQTVPIAVSCPPTPPIPQAISEYASPAMSLIEGSALRSLKLRQKISETLKKASGQPM